MTRRAVSSADKKRDLDVHYRATASLVPYAANPRTHSPEQVQEIAESIREYGWTNPVLVDGATGIIAGHGRVLAAKLLGIDTVPCIELAHLSEAQRRAYIIADNKLATKAGWDNSLLAGEFGALKGLGFDLKLTGFDMAEVGRVLALAGAHSGKTDPDAIPEPPEQPLTRAGDVWRCGRHRLMCGDSTSAEAVAALMAGHKAQMVFTDPPYGVDYTGGMKRRERLSGDHVGTDIYSAALRHLRSAADDRASLYLWYADVHAAAAAARAAAAEAGYQIVAQIVWAKNHAQFVTSAHYKVKHEPCYYGHRRGKSARWHGPNNEVTLWEYDRSPSNEFHPTQKPVALAERAIKNSSSPGEIVLDLFLGGGTTMIAAEMTGRTCFGMEIEPAYVDVAVLRWEQFTGERAGLEARRVSVRESAQRRSRGADVPGADVPA